MRTSGCLRLLLGLFLSIPIFVLLAVIEDKCETYSPLSFLRASMPWSTQDLDNEGPTQSAGIIVVPAMDNDDVSWIFEELPEWQSAIYYVEHPSDGGPHDHTNLSTPANKGNEAMAYLSYIIDHYHQPIPNVVAFLHSHRDGFFRAWHVDTPLHSNVDSIRNLQMDYVLKHGFVNLRCNVNPGCSKLGHGNEHVTERLWREIFEDTSTPFFDQSFDGPAAVAAMSSVKEPPGEDLLLQIMSPCCAQFAVSAAQIYKRPLQDYVRIQRWLLETTLDNAHSGRVMEFLWHIIFGKEAVLCPDPQTCYCEVYGRC